jgi:hypothetical protein
LLVDGFFRKQAFKKRRERLEKKSFFSTGMVRETGGPEYPSAYAKLYSFSEWFGGHVRR